MPHLIINGQAQSPYVRAARMACIESGIDHELRPLAGAQPPTTAGGRP